VNRPDPSASAWRGARGGVLAALAWLTVVTAHVMASGALPSSGALIATGVLAAVVGISFAGRRLTWRRSFAALLLLQPTLHLALTTLAAGAHHHHHTFHDASANWAMVAAHVAAAALAAWWVSVADALLLRMLRCVQDRLRVPWPVRLNTLTWPQHIVLGRDSALGCWALLTDSITRRGPPLALVA
jgi:hypothetical protein